MGVPELHRACAEVGLKRVREIITYLELGQTEVADLHMQLVVDKHIVALNVAVDDAEAVHVTEGCRDVLGDLDARLVGQIDVLPQMQHVVETALANVLEDDVDIRDLRNDTHQQHDVWMAQYTLHDDLVLNFL